MKYLTTTQVAEVIGETSENVSRRCSKGQIRATKLGHSWRIAESEITAFMQPNNGAPSPRIRNLTARQKREQRKRAT